LSMGPFCVTRPNPTQPMDNSGLTHNGKSICSADFAQLAGVTNRQTDTQTTLRATE